MDLVNARGRINSTLQGNPWTLVMRRAEFIRPAVDVDITMYVIPPWSNKFDPTRGSMDFANARGRINSTLQGNPRTLVMRRAEFIRPAVDVDITMRVIPSRSNEFDPTRESTDLVNARGRINSTLQGDPWALVMRRAEFIRPAGGGSPRRKKKRRPKSPKTLREGVITNRNLTDAFGANLLPHHLRQYFK